MLVLKWEFKSSALFRPLRAWVAPFCVCVWRSCHDGQTPFRLSSGRSTKKTIFADFRISGDGSLLHESAQNALHCVVCVVVFFLTAEKQNSARIIRWRRGECHRRLNSLELKIHLVRWFISMVHGTETLPSHAVAGRDPTPRNEESGSLPLLCQFERR